MATIHTYGPLGPGHVNPTLAIVAELVRRGHNVTYWAPRPFAGRITETGASFRPMVSTWEQLTDEPPQMHGAEFIRAMGLLLDETKAVLPELVAAPVPDVVLHDGPLAWWGRILADRWNVPAVETWPNFVSNRHWSMQTYTKLNLADPRLLWQLFRIGRYLRRHGIREVGAFMQGSTAAARIVTLPRSFQYAGNTFEGWDFVGPCLTGREFHGDWTPPDSDRPVLLVSLGTAYNVRPDFYRMIVESAADHWWHVVLVIGERVDPAELGPIPRNIEVHGQVPQLTVLQHARVFVTHAGMGSTVESIHQRVPLVAVPQMAEQRANADRIAELGLGCRLDPAHLDAETLWAAVDTVGGDVDTAERLTRMRADMDAAGGAVRAADVVERVLHKQ